MRSRLLAVVLAATVVGAACNGSDAATPASTTIDASLDDALATLPTPAPVSPVAAPTTTRAPIEVRSFPDPDWPAVQIPVGPPVTPIGLGEVMSDAPGPAYDISPDGTHIVLIGSNRLCVAPVDDPSDLTCADGIDPTAADWSPDSSKVLFYEESFIESRSGPLGTFAIDGTLGTLMETDDPTSPFGGATAAAFVDDDTVVYAQMIVDEASGAVTYEVHTIAADGSDDAVIGTLDIGTGNDVFLPMSAEFDGTTVYFEPNGLSMRPGTWRFDPESDSIGLIEPADEGAAFSAHPVDVRNGMLITADGGRLGAFTSNRDAAGFFTISSIDRSISVVIDDLDADYMILSAALSPDGAHLAVFEYYRGADEAIVDSEASGRVSITSTGSLLRGEPAWTTLTGVGPGAPSVELDGPATITWPTPDRIQVQLIDRAFVIEVGAA